MRSDLHPSYHSTKVVCACGHSWETRSTATGGELHLDICSTCHPFFTGKQKLMDTQGRIDRFNKKYAAQATAKKAGAEQAPEAAKAEPKAEAKKEPKEKKAKAPKAEKKADA